MCQGDRVEHKQERREGITKITSEVWWKKLLSNGAKEKDEVAWKGRKKEMEL